MNKVVYVLGTSHAYQRNDGNCEPSAIEEFIEYLKFVCQLYGIRAIGEEMSLSALEDYDRKQSIPAKFSQNFNLKHKYCDPERNEQEHIGIKPSGFYTQFRKFSKSFPLSDELSELRDLSKEEADELEWKEDLKREPLWLCNILELNVWPLLFICGSKHVESFSKLLAAASFDVKIANNNWPPPPLCANVGETAYECEKNRGDLRCGTDSCNMDRYIEKPYLVEISNL